MSALGGIYNFDEAPVDSGLLHALGEGLNARGPDGGGEHRSDSIGMAYRAFNTTKEAWQETQPFVSHDGYILTWDGRLDNRDVLLAELPGGLLGDTTDVALVMAAYLSWGTDFLTPLVGDFTLSLWDSNTRTLLLARDAFGTRPLYYHTNAKRIVWSSEMRPLLDLDGIEAEVDDDYIAGYLTDRAELWHTPYKSIRTVQPGHILIVRDAHIQERRFWAPDPKKEIRYRNDSDYEEHFRLLFRESVRSRLRSDRTVWSQLSGGFDSSSIVCVADQIIASSEAPISELQTVSYIYDDSPTSDEREFIACVEAQRGSLSLYIREDDDLTFAYYPNETLACIPNPLIAPSNRYGRMCDELQRRGARVLLSGQCGDHLLWSGIDAPPDLADFMVKFKPLEMHRRILAWSRALKKPYIQLLWKGAVLPVLPQWIQASQYTNTTLPLWLNEEFVTRMKLRERMLHTADTFGFRLPSRKMQSAFLSSAISLISSGYYRARSSIEIRLPYLHLPLVEFLLAIPFEQKIRPGETRSLHRRALGEVLPTRIARRKGKRGTDEAFYRGLAREWSRLDSMFANAIVCSRGYADSVSLREALNRARYGNETHTHILSRIISIEFWLRALRHRSSEARTTVVAEEAAAF